MDIVKALFDINFSRFVTLKIAGVTLIVLYLIETLVALGVLADGFQKGGGLGLVTLAGVAIGLPLTFLFTRVWIELSVSLVKAAEETSKIREILEKKKIDTN